MNKSYQDKSNPGFREVPSKSRHYDTEVLVLVTKASSMKFTSRGSRHGGFEGVAEAYQRFALRANSHPATACTKNVLLLGQTAAGLGPGLLV